jgi:hypothetical protein
MSISEHTWPSDAFDAVSIRLAHGDVSVCATDEDQVKLEGEPWARVMPINGPQPVGRWLMIHLDEQEGRECSVTLRLPKSKAWVVRLRVSHGDVDVSDIQARLHVRLGAGDVQITDCRGIFSVIAGAGDIGMERCTEADMPEPPDADARWVSPPGADEMSWGMPGDEMRQAGHGWAAWANGFAQYAPGWSHHAGRAFDRKEEGERTAGVALRLGAGDVNLHELEVAVCRMALGHGDVTLEGGCIGDLRIDTSQGDIECGSVLPTGDWAIWTGHGDISLSVPANAQARLDAATRHGDIESDVPLVRVARPGPEARHGGRMVGALGKADGEAPPISLTAMRGDIEIKVGDAASRARGAGG